MNSITVNLPENVELYRAKMVIATSLYRQEILSSEQAAELVGITRRQFLKEADDTGYRYLEKPLKI